MIWDKDISFDGLIKKWRTWYDRFNKKSACIVPDPPIEAQYALDLIFKTLIDDKENYPYLTTMSESTEQTNSIMLDLILTKYSRKYRKYMRKMKKENMLRERAEIRCGVYNRDAVSTEGNINMQECTSNSTHSNALSESGDTGKKIDGHTNEIPAPWDQITVKFNDVIPYDALSEELKELIRREYDKKSIDPSNYWFVVGNTNDGVILIAASPQSITIRTTDIPKFTSSDLIEPTSIETAYGTNSPYTNMLKAWMNGLKDPSAKK